MKSILNTLSTVFSPSLAARGWLEIQDAKNDAKNRHLGTIPQLCRAIFSHVRHVSIIGKNMLSSNMSSTCPHNMVNFGPLAAEIGSLVWDTPANFNGFRVLASLLQQRRSSEANQTARCLAVSWAGNTFSGALAR